MGKSVCGRLCPVKGCNSIWALCLISCINALFMLDPLVAQMFIGIGDDGLVGFEGWRLNGTRGGRNAKELSLYGQWYCGTDENAINSRVAIRSV